MKLATKIMARVIVLPLMLAAGLAATAMLTVQIMFKPADLEAIVTNQFQELLKRPVRIEWAKMAYTGEIKIKGLKVTEPGPEMQDFITAEYIYATYRWLPLLKRRIEIDSVLLVSPSITLIRRKDGTWNTGDILEAYRKTPGRNLLNKIDSTEVKDGKLSIFSQPANTRYSFDNFNATMNDFRPEADSKFHASVFFKSDALGQLVTGRLYAEGTVNFAGFRWEKAALSDFRADLTLQDKTASFSGSVNNFHTPEISLKGETPQLKSSDLAYLFTSPVKFAAPRSSWEIDVVTGSSSTIRARLFTRPLNIKAEGTVDLSKPVPDYNFTVSAPPLALEQLKRYGASLPLETPSGKVQLRLKVISKQGLPSVSRLFLNTDKTSFKHRNLSVSGLKMSSLMSESFANSYINVTGGKVQLDDNILAGLRIKTEITGKHLLVNYSGKLNGNPAKGRLFSRNFLADWKTLDLTGYSENITYEEIKGLTFGIRDLRGPRVGMPEFKSSLNWLRILKNAIPVGLSSVKVLYKAGMFKHDYLAAKDFYVSADLRNIAGDLSMIKGDISLRSGPGAFYDVQDTSEKDHIFYIFSLPLTFMNKMNRTGALKFDSRIKDVSFDSIGGACTAFGDGKVEIKDFYIDSRDFSAQVSGQLDFYNETMKLKIYTISDKYSKMGSLPEALTDASGKPALAFTLEGRMADPEFKMISPKESGKIIKAAATRGVAIDFDRINSFAGGKK